MELYATGFNAWNQLHFEAPENGEPDDVFGFTCVLEDESLSNVRPFLSYTVVTTSGGVKISGSPPKEHAALHKSDLPIHVNFVEASNGIVVVYDDAASIYQYPSASILLSNTEKTTFAPYPQIAQAVAYETGFAIRSSCGHVVTWGDGRYPACLGREVNEKSPADRPGMVEQVLDLPTGEISKIAAGGYTLAAVTSGHDLYCWGGHPSRPPMFDISEDPTPVVVEDRDVVDVAVGESHLVVLTGEGDVFAIGDNKNGQLGLAREKTKATTWTKVDVPLRSGQRVSGVAAGPRSSFLLVREGR